MSSLITVNITGTISAICFIFHEDYNNGFYFILKILNIIHQHKPAGGIKELSNYPEHL